MNNNFTGATGPLFTANKGDSIKVNVSSTIDSQHIRNSVTVVSDKRNGVKYYQL